MITAPINITSQQREFIESYVLGDYFPWFRTAYQVDRTVSNYVDSAFFSHQFMKRTEDDAETSGIVNSPHFDFFAEIFTRWMQDNNQPFERIYRAAINCVYPNKDIAISTPHVDHPFLHNNWIMYLTTNANAETLLFTEDLTIEHAIPCCAYTAGCFSHQLHAHRYPTDKQRIVVVFTYA